MVKLHKIDTVNGHLVTPIFGAYHLPARESPNTIALVTWSKEEHLGYFGYMRGDLDLQNLVTKMATRV